MNLQQIQISSTSVEGFGQGSVTLPRLQISAHGSGDIVSPPMPPSRIILPPPPSPLQIRAHDSIQVEDDSDISEELRQFLTELERLQQLAVVWGKRNPIAAWLVMVIVSALIIQAIDALFQ
jgi:hypothetical protein